MTFFDFYSALQFKFFTLFCLTTLPGMTALAFVLAVGAWDLGRTTPDWVGDWGAVTLPDTFGETALLPLLTGLEVFYLGFSSGSELEEVSSCFFFFLVLLMCCFFS